MAREPKPGPVVIGWREWITLPRLGIQNIKTKIDTGARTSSLHVVHLEKFVRDDSDWVRFSVHPLQRSTRETIQISTPVLEYRIVRSSSGHAVQRPVILTEVKFLGQRWPIEVTLANRAAMGFRMLLGREAVRGRFVVDPGRSWYGGRPEMGERNKKRSKTKKRPRKKIAKRANAKARAFGRRGSE